jgi:signal transduction histidine kinase
LHLEADRLRLVQVLTNLLTNAAKYTPSAGRIELTGTADKGEFVLSVVDTGIGIELDRLSAIFAMFASDSRPAAAGWSRHRTRAVESLIELHGGRLTALSE